MAVQAPGLLIATNNAGKLSELACLLSDSRHRILSLSDARIDLDVAESGSTFEENAALKARTYAQESGTLTLADDSGLEVEALGGEPGVLSSRYAGEGATDEQRIAFLLQKLNNISVAYRGARFRCVLALAAPGGPVELYEGECYGRILDAPHGTNGFGYDPIFLVDGLGRTMAELTAEEKNRVSHRGRAANRVVEALRARLEVRRKQGKV